MDGRECTEVTRELLRNVRQLGTSGLAFKGSDALWQQGRKFSLKLRVFSQKMCCIAASATKKAVSL